MSKSKKTDVTRERALRRASGIYPDFKYRSLSGTIQYNTWFSFKADPTLLLTQYRTEAANRTTLVSLPVRYGTEFIRSSRNPPPSFNYCLHEKQQGVNYAYGAIAHSYSIGSISHLPSNTYRLPFWRTTHYDETMVTPAYSRMDIGRVINDIGFSNTAFSSMQPKFEGQVSMLNFIFELKDFKDLGRAFLRLPDKLFKPTYRRRLHDVAWKPGEPTGVVAGLWLLKQFAIDPLVKDFAAISAQAMTSAQRAQAKFAQKGVEGNTMHFKENLVNSNSYPPPPLTNYYYWADGRSIRLSRNATLRMKYSYVKRSTISAFVHYWGLTGTAEAFWNMIPFSFVADYFLSVGKTLSMMRRDKNVALTEYEYCESAKYIQTAGRHFRTDPRVAAFVIDGQIIDTSYDDRYHLVSGTQHTLYLRQPKQPSKGTVLLTPHGPSNTQMVNMAALLRCVL